MKYFTAILAACLTCACGAEDDGAPTQVEVRADHAHAISNGFRFDRTLLAERPSGQLPAQRLGVEAFAPENVTGALLGTQEAFDDSRSISRRLIAESAGWHYEQNFERGRILVLSKAKPGAARPLRRLAVRRQAMQRLVRFGIPLAEVARVVQTSSMRQDRDGDENVGEPELHRHKTFVWRGIEGVPIEGHRAVVTHTPDGAFHRALIKWPALAADGHRLGSDLPDLEIERRAVNALRESGESHGDVSLRWVYIPTLTAQGTVTVELKVIARIAEAQHEDYTEEPRLIEVNVDAR